MRFAVRITKILTISILLTGCSLSHNGVKPVYPSVGFNSLNINVDSLTPTLKWEAYSGEDVKYELRIFEEKVSEGSTLGLHHRYPSLVYSRSNISGTEHTVETPLKPSHYYMWAVKPVEGETEWSSYDFFYFYVLVWGYGQKVPYHFWTPYVGEPN